MNLSPCSACGVAVEGTALSGLCAACLLSAAADQPPDSCERLLEPGSTLGPYEIVSMLGRGGMGHVYLGWDTAVAAVGLSE